MVRVPCGGRKKKLKHTTPSRDATTAGREPQAVATKRTIKRKQSATVVGLALAPSSFNKPVAAAIPNIAAP